MTKSPGGSTTKKILANLGARGVGCLFALLLMVGFPLFFLAIFGDVPSGVRIVVIPAGILLVIVLWIWAYRRLHNAWYDPDARG